MSANPYFWYMCIVLLKSLYGFLLQLNVEVLTNVVCIERLQDIKKWQRLVQLVSLDLCPTQDTLSFKLAFKSLHLVYRDFFLR